MDVVVVCNNNGEATSSGSTKSRSLVNKIMQQNIYFNTIILYSNNALPYRAINQNENVIIIFFFNN